MRSHTIGKLAQRFGVVLITIGMAFSLAPRAAEAAGWSYSSVPLAGSVAMAADTVRFGSSTYTAYVGQHNATYWPWRIARHDSSGQVASDVALPGACTGYSSNSNGISTIVAYGQIHVFAEFYNGPYICHAWSSDGVNFSLEYLAPNLSYSEGISTALWNNQLHIVARGADGGVEHTWYDPVGGHWISEKLDEVGTADDMSAYAESAIGIYHGQFHVVYVTNAGIIRDRWWDPYGGHWNWTTTFGAYTLNSTDSAGLDVETSYGGQFHIVYRATDGNMKHAWYDPAGGVWRNDTMTVGSAPIALTSTRVKVFLYNNQWHALYAPNTGGVGHIWWDPVGASWKWELLDVSGSLPLYALDAVSYSGRLDIYATDAATLGLRLLRYG